GGRARRRRRSRSGGERGDITLARGDALCLDLGRDRFEAAGFTWSPAPYGLRPGVGSSAAIWLAGHEFSLLCWDMMDAIHPDEPVGGPVHPLMWAIGLLLIATVRWRTSVTR